MNKTKIISLSIPNELDNDLEKIIDEARQKGYRITKSSLINTAIINFLGTCAYEVDNIKATKGEEN